MAKKKTPPGQAKKPTKPVAETPVSKEVIRDYTPGKDSIKKGQRVMWPPAPKKSFLQKSSGTDTESDIFESKKNQKRGTVPKENANWLLVSRGKKPVPKPEPSLPVEPIRYVKGMQVYKNFLYTDSGNVWEALSNQKTSTPPKENTRWRLVSAAPVAEPPVVMPPEVPAQPPYVPPVEPQPIPEPEPPKEEEPKPEEPETPEAPTPEPPVEEEPAKPVPDPPHVPEPPREPEGPTGERTRGNIKPFTRDFANNVGQQNFGWTSDGAEFTGGYRTTTARKPFGPVDIFYFLIPEQLQAENIVIRLADGAGTATKPYSFAGLYRDANGKFTTIEDIIPPFFGKQYKQWTEHRVEERGSRLYALVNIVAIDEATRNIHSAIPTEIEIIADYTPYRKPTPKPKPIVKYQQLIGANVYTYSICSSSGRGLSRTDKLEVVNNCLRTVRLYLNIENSLKDGKFTFQPMSGGAWSLDDILRNNTDHGIHTVICLRGMDKTETYQDFFYNTVARYGKNKGVDPATLNIYTGTGYPANEVKIGLGYNVSFQILNEADGSWKPRNLVFLPFEMAELHAKIYKRAKAINPDANIVSNGFALTQPGYIDAMCLWFKMHNDGVIAFDMLTYHDYCNEKGGQRVGAVGALPAEMTNYYQHVLGLRECLDFWSPDRHIPLGMGETGFSISTVNPEQAVKPLGDRGIFEVQADLHDRTIFESWAAGLEWLADYQLYDDAAFVRNPTGHVNWDQANGIADRNTNDIHRRRPATDHNYQMLKHLIGYHMSRESDRTAPVREHMLSKDGAPDMLAVFVPTYEDRKVNYTVKYGLSGVKSVTLIRPLAGADNAEETDVSINGSLTVEATESILYIRVNRV